MEKEGEVKKRGSGINQKKNEQEKRKENELEGKRKK